MTSNFNKYIIETYNDVYLGKQFNENHTGDKFVKVINDERKHFGFIYKEGMNIDTNKFEPSVYCAGGLYFTKEKYVSHFIDYGSDVWDITIPDDALVHEFEDGEYKADKFIISSPRKIRYDEYMEIVEEDGRALEFVPFELKNKEMCEVAVNRHGCALQFVPSDLRTKELYDVSAKKSGCVI